MSVRTAYSRVRPYLERKKEREGERRGFMKDNQQVKTCQAKQLPVSHTMCVIVLVQPNKLKQSSFLKVRMEFLDDVIKVSV